jgi:hypothetical protein
MRSPRPVLRTASQSLLRLLCCMPPYASLLTLELWNDEPEPGLHTKVADIKLHTVTRDTKATHELLRLQARESSRTSAKQTSPAWLRSDCAGEADSVVSLYRAQVRAQDLAIDSPARSPCRLPPSLCNCNTRILKPVTSPAQPWKSLFCQATSSCLVVSNNIELSN